MIALKDTNYLCNVRRSTRIVNTKKVKCFKLTTFFFGAFCISFFLFIATSCTDRDLSFYLEKITHNLSVPTNLNATATDGQVQLSWDVKADLAYYVYWSTNSGVDINNGTKIENVTSPFKHTKLTNGRMYYYIITANNGFTISPPTNEVSAIPSKTPSPTGLTAVAGNAQVTLSWNFVSGTTYTLYWSQTSGVNTTNGTPISNVISPHTHMGAGVSNGNTYYYVLTATNRFGVSLPSPEISATPMKTPAPMGLMAVGGISKVEISWTTVSGTTYTLYWSQTPGVNTINGAPISNVISPHTHMGTDVVNGIPHYYVLTATTTAFGTSPPTAEVMATPIQTTPSPTGLMATAGISRVEISWTVVMGTTYDLYWSQTQGTGVSGNKVTNVTSPYTHMGAGVSNGNTYFYVLTAKEMNSVISPPSPETSATPVQTTPSPTGLMATAGISRVEISWTVVMGTTYDLYWSQTQGTGVSGNKVTNVTSPYTHMGAGVSNGNTYFYVLTAKEMNSVISPPSPETSATPVQTVAIWTLGVQDGDFGYNACETERASGGTNSIGAKLTGLGYTKAVFFGSTNDYHFNAIVSDMHGLNLTGTGHPLRLFKLSGMGVAKEVDNTGMKTIQDIVSPTNSNMERADIFNKIKIRPVPVNLLIWWTFTEANGTQQMATANSAPTPNCGNARSTTLTGKAGRTEDAGTSSSHSCSTTFHVVCVAK